jgi:hypothetical protein
VARAAVSGVAVALLVVAGCATQDGPGGDAPSPSATGAAPLTPAALLGAEQMPAWNDAMGWAEAQLPTGVAPLSVCALPEPGTLGATQVLERTFEATGSDEPGTTPDPTWPASYGVNVVGLFPSEAEAIAAVDAWEAAIGDCAAGASGAAAASSSRISELATGSTWAASAFEATPACPECLRFEFIGVAAKGSAVTLVGFALSGQDANYEGDPLAAAMAASLQRLP